MFPRVTQKNPRDQGLVEAHDCGRRRRWLNTWPRQVGSDSWSNTNEGRLHRVCRSHCSEGQQVGRHTRTNTNLLWTQMQKGWGKDYWINWVALQKWVFFKSHMISSLDLAKLYYLTQQKWDLMSWVDLRYLEINLILYTWTHHCTVYLQVTCIPS